MINKETLAPQIGTTIERFIKNEIQTNQDTKNSLVQVLLDIVLASKIINQEINKAGLLDIAKELGSENIHGENQQILDYIANKRFIRALKNGKETAAIVSEEEEHIIHTDHKNAKYVVALDPLDGSSNFKVNGPVGTIFTVFERISPIGTEATKEDFLQGGRKQLISGYILYSASIVLVFTTGNGVHGFTYDTSYGEFYLTHKNIKIPSKGDIYAINEGKYIEFSKNARSYIMQSKLEMSNLRYSGAFVFDLHRILICGGIYLYPSTKKSTDGKLRLLYECFPLAFIIEQAGGAALNDSIPILDIKITDIHQCSPIYIGSKTNIKQLMKYQD